MNTISIDLTKHGAESLKEAKEGSSVEVECCLCGKVAKNDGKTLELEVEEVEMEGESEAGDSKPKSLDQNSAAVIAITVEKK